MESCCHKLTIKEKYFKKAIELDCMDMDLAKLNLAELPCQEEEN
jgi:hypothetical protein